ncbi:HEXXH motif domain-containing protein [Amycolatopsis sp. WQ 127309]|uniref:HEXXH motif domain-containing protein n=1 Tax=Amycolatopsis sp. WQ 127309 TaxID=2932773 RepID=UPI001FF65B34|nr:HEXXH motif domain-containing protein [Amycolatopsis sp. WQ 127309]UOZ07548.1 HEXXH motif domain-containing protein [Amycolatopsis sp. WQ 127309]
MSIRSSVPIETPTESLVHGVSWAEFDLLARSEGGPAPVRRLRAAERSRRLLLLRAIIDETTGHPDRHGPLASVDTAWDLLVLAEETDPRALEDVLTHPYTGSWVGYTTRLLRHQDVIDSRPLWVHIGHLHALAAAAAIRAGVAGFRIQVPAWRGLAALPTLGIAHIDGLPDSATVEVRSVAGRVEISACGRIVVIPADSSADAPGWRGVRKVELDSGGQRLAIRIDDVDPYRGLHGPRSPYRLSPEDLGLWRNMLGRAWELITRLVPGYADALPAGLDTIVPDPPFPFRLPSASSGEAFGSAVICRPEDPATLAAALVHEFQHIRLGGLLQIAALHSSDRAERLYAPWRDDPRPLGGVIHGIYAFFAVTEFYRALSGNQPDDELAAFEFAHWRHQVGNTLADIREDAELTDAGHRFLDHLADRLEDWRHDEVTTAAAGWSALMAADHHAGWRLRHHRPAPDTVDRLVGAWLGGATVPGADSAATILVTDPDGRWAEARADLLRVRLGADGERRARQVWRDVSDASEADLALVNGDGEAALEGYRAELRRDPDLPVALVGLGLALRMTHEENTAAVILNRPELVRAVHRGIRKRTNPAPTPEEVARWLATTDR